MLNFTFSTLKFGCKNNHEEVIIPRYDIYKVVGPSMLME